MVDGSGGWSWWLVVVVGRSGWAWSGGTVSDGWCASWLQVWDGERLRHVWGGDAVACALCVLKTTHHTRRDVNPWSTDLHYHPPQLRESITHFFLFKPGSLTLPAAAPLLSEAAPLLLLTIKSHAAAYVGSRWVAWSEMSCESFIIKRSNCDNSTSLFVIERSTDGDDPSIESSINSFAIGILQVGQCR